MLERLKQIPLWLKLIMLATQGLFLFAVVVTLYGFYSDKTRHQAYDQATQQQKLYREAITKLGDFRGVCTLKRIKTDPSKELTQLCESAELQLVEALESLDYPAYEI